VAGVGQRGHDFPPGEGELGIAVDEQDQGPGPLRRVSGLEEVHIEAVGRAVYIVGCDALRERERGKRASGR